MRTTQAVRIHRHGPPREVVKVEEIPVVEPGAGEVLVRVEAAPINPADINVIEGKYPICPELPGVLGNEGAGVVVESGGETGGFLPGVKVLFPMGAGAWRQWMVAKASELVRVPDTIDIEQAATLRVNPPTAWRMLHDFVALEPGDWVIQNAANSAVGRAVIGIAHALGLRTVNMVRRPELIEELKKDGADVVLVEPEDFAGAVREATGGAKISLGFNAVGGESALGIANSLATGGTLVTFGAMSKKPLRIPNGMLIFKDLRWRGFWLTRWWRESAPEAQREMFARLFELTGRGVLKTPIEARYPFEQALEAIEHAQRENRSGKILFRNG